jgi:hypothetical protein
MGWVVNATPQPFFPRKTWYPLYRKLGGPRSGLVWKISPPPGFDPLTFEPVVSRYADTAIPNGQGVYSGSL